MEKQRESHVKSLRLLQLEKAIQNLTYPSAMTTHPSRKLSQRFTTQFLRCFQIRSRCRLPCSTKFSLYLTRFQISTAMFSIRFSKLSNNTKPSALVTVLSAVPSIRPTRLTPIRFTVRKATGMLSASAINTINTAPTIFHA